MSYAKPCKKLIHKNGSFTMTKPKQHEDDIIIQIIVIISILITTLLDALKCLISLSSASSTPNPGKQELLSSDTTLTSSGSIKTQRLSPSTKQTLNYGGPEEGGWHYYVGYPCLTHCIFSKKQAIKEYLIYSEEYEVWEQPDLGLTSTHSNYDISYSNEYAKFYPTERPYYC
jgi:hypothetical protein